MSDFFKGYNNNIHLWNSKTCDRQMYGNAAKRKNTRLYRDKYTSSLKPLKTFF